MDINLVQRATFGNLLFRGFLRWNNWLDGITSFIIWAFYCNVSVFQFVFYSTNWLQKFANFIVNKIDYKPESKIDYKLSKLQGFESLGDSQNPLSPQNLFLCVGRCIVGIGQLKMLKVQPGQKNTSVSVTVFANKHWNHTWWGVCVVVLVIVQHGGLLAGEGRWSRLGSAGETFLSFYSLAVHCF